jgi:hypothetical protein
MGWLIGPTLASFVAAFIVVKVFDYALSHAASGLTDKMASAARASLFIGTWTAVTAKAGMNGFSQKARQLRAGTASAIKALSKGERP